jgi:probable O-glycosylation ligase (exosortase A-associated)
MTGVMMLSVLAALGSHSRGALLAIVAMAAFLWWKSRNKFVMAFMLVMAGIVGLSFMPAEWWERMHTISSYNEDASALGRINAWQMAFNLAKDRPLGGGFDIYDFDTFGRYAPDPLDVHAAHSIYFQIMGEHGFIGLLLFMSIGFTTWVMAGRTARMARQTPELLWAAQLMDMVKVSMIGYAVGGAFLSLAYFDVPYFVIVVVVATHELVRRAPRQRAVTGAWRTRGANGFVRAQPAMATAESLGLAAAEPPPERPFGTAFVRK